MGKDAITRAGANAIDTSATVTGATRVFLSYSRRDAAQMQRLADALLAHPDYEPDFDQNERDPHNVNAGIAADEPWWRRPEELIAAAEIVVFLVSPASAASKVCDEEIAYAQRLGKRIIPVLAAPVDYAKLPPKLAALNIKIDLTDTGEGFDAGFGKLIEALSVNARWLREGRSYAERAAKWARDGKRPSDLLTASAYEEAEAWAAKRPKNEPEPGELFTDWIAESRLNVRRQIIRERHRQRRNAAIIAVMFTLAIVSLWGGVQGFRELHKANSKALLIAAQTAAADNRLDRAMRLAALANQGERLKPPHPDADAAIGDLAFRSQVEATLLGHGDERYLQRVIFAPDGRSLAAIWSDGSEGISTSTVRIWSKSEGGPWTSNASFRQRGGFNALEFAPDGLRAVTATSDGTARVWTKGPRSVWNSTPLEGHDGFVVFAAFSPDARRVVTTSEDRTARVWSIGEDGSWTGTLLKGHSDTVRSADFSPDGRRVVTASYDGTARVWREGNDGNWTGVSLEGHGDAVLSAAFSPDGLRVVTASVDGTARVWREDEGGDWLAQVLEGHKDSVKTAAFSPDSRLVVTASSDSTARVWHQDDGDVWISASLEGYQGSVSSAAFSPDGQRVVIASFGGPARVWIKGPNGKWTELLPPEGGRVDGEVKAVSPDGMRWVTGSREGYLRIWPTTANGPWIESPILEHLYALGSFSKDGQHFAVASGGIALIGSVDKNGKWDLTRLQTPHATSATFSPDGQHVVTVSDRIAHIWRKGEDGVWASTPLEGHRDWVRSAAFSPDGQRVVTASGDKTARVWRERADGVWTASVLEGHEGYVLSAAFSPDGRRVITASVDTTARVWREVESGIWTATVLEGHQSEVNSAAFSPDGRFVFTVSSDLTTRVWHENIDGSWASRPLVGAEENILAIAFSPDGQRVLTTSIFDSLWVWSARNDMTWMGTPIVSRRSQVSERSTTREFRPAVFSPDGLQVAQATEEGTARVLDVRYLAGPEDWVTSEPRPRAAAICEERMSNSLFEDRHPDRLITQGDAEAYPALQGRVGEDVCAPLVNPPPWWRALTFWE